MCSPLVVEKKPLLAFPKYLLSSYIPQEERGVSNLIYVLSLTKEGKRQRIKKIRSNNIKKIERI